MKKRTPDIPVESFLLDFPPNVVEIVHRLRAIVKRALPDATERVYPGWRLIGYRALHGHGKRDVYVGFIAPLRDSVRLGFERGVRMHDPNKLLRGDGTQVRYVEVLSLDDIDDSALIELVVEGKRAALAS